MERYRSIIQQAEQDARPFFSAIGEMAYQNQVKVLESFRHNRIELRHFSQSNGYGYGDLGRDTLDRLFADVFGAEKALVRPQIASGTHALSLCLYALARPGKIILSITGQPYDTLLDTIGGEGDENGEVMTLHRLGTRFIQQELDAQGQIDIALMSRYLQTDDTINMIYIQRSRGYEWRDSLRLAQIKKACDAARALRPHICIVVDNCYGEFVEEAEPLSAGADIIVGSLIKNPGGGLAPTGAYLAGREKYVNMIQYRLTAPGIGAEVGSWPAGYRPFYQGLFLAPHVVGESLKGAVLAARVFELMGLAVLPRYDMPRADIIQSIRFGKKESLLQFCAAVQAASPVDSHVVPEPWAMPGYQHEVVMAAGAFVQGASLELSADAPIKPPYIGYLQGGLTYEHCRYAIESVLRALTGG